MISLTNVVRAYGNVHALAGVSLEVGEREVVTVVGPSGCGKSTLLRIIAGLDFPTSGSVHIDGKDVTAIPAQKRNMAMVFQSYALYPHMTCYENLALNLRLKRLPPAEVERRVSEAARLLGIEDLMQKKPRALSGGQRQRVAVGRALVRDPKAFLLDEPLSNLDAQLRERVRHEMKQLFQKLNAAVLYVTHDQVEAMTLADRMVVLNGGRVEQVGAPDDVYRHPGNRFVASFIGSPAMNIFEAVLDSGRVGIGSEVIDTGLGVSGRFDVGIRPELIHVGSGSPAKLAWVENLGSEFLAGVRVGDIDLTVRTARRPATGDLAIHVRPEAVHVFDKDSGASIPGNDRRRTDRA